MNDWQSRLIEMGREYGVFVLIGLVGLGLIISGLVSAQGGSTSGRDSKVEIVFGEQQAENGMQQDKIVVDVAGAVENPGVYELEKDSRIGEAISMAGGLSESADREWVTRYLNLAGEVEDGGKVFIPSKTEDAEAPNSNNQISNNDQAQNSKLININTTSASELDSLWGIGESRADSIIANRPYSSVEELESKAGVPSNVYERIKDQVSVY